MYTTSRDDIKAVVDSLVRARGTSTGNLDWDPLPKTCCAKLAADLNNHYQIRLSASELHGKTVLGVSVLVQTYIGYRNHGLTETRHT
jgi:hypothetical protein